MKVITGAVLTAVLLAATPAMADRGFNGHRGFDSHRGHFKHQGHHKHHFRHHHRHPPVVHPHAMHYYDPWRPAPVVYYPRPAPVGVSIVLPSLYIPIR